MKHAATRQLFNYVSIMQQKPIHQDLVKQELHYCEGKWRRSKDPQEIIRRKLRRSMVRWESDHEHHVSQECQGKIQSHLWKWQRLHFHRPQSKRIKHQVQNASRWTALSWHGEQTSHKSKKNHQQSHQEERTTARRRKKKPNNLSKKLTKKMKSPTTTYFPCLVSAP